ncbi:translation initiation factor eIF3 subunit [Lactarius akahatsu]|uniref:Eukaryotic translation initiation factor 3 30 kDa subunit n=1 Tax=Lactarius akahatsu TaxID=416441 RepID=A0AAD4LA14_9AGAM|nr:translation initiation factor eIF3 subunit [Lactarius akahatsu]
MAVHSAHQRRVPYPTTQPPRANGREKTRMTMGRPQSDWEASSEDDEVKAKPAATAAAPPKKKGTLKQKLAEKEAARRAQLAAGGSDADYDEDAVLDPHAKARLEKERELESDLQSHNATELFGSADADLDNILKSSPSSKGDFVALSEAIIAHIVKRHQDKPLYSTFVEHHVRALAMPLRDREKTSGKKKTKAAAKPVLGASEVGNKLDTTVCGEALDDIGPNADDFM